MIEIVLACALVLSVVGNIFQLTGRARLNELVQRGLDDAAKSRTTRVRLSINDVLQHGFTPRNGLEWSYPDQLFRDPAEFRHKPGPHPATLSPHRRSKL